jgi:cellulose biosynthesis protein BcsQ
MKVITCFSYKGGAARTTAAANIAAALSSIAGDVGSIKSPLRQKVALLDLDVFSAGTHRVFDITNEEIEEFKRPFIQDYLREQMTPKAYVDQGGVSLKDPLMKVFRMKRGADENCHPEFTLFPAKPDPGVRFVVQKQHENVLIELLMELESARRGFDYVILDGESGTRQMADIAVRLADVVLIFFRLTWQHIDGTLVTAKKEFEDTNPRETPFYLIPTCVPLVDPQDNVYQEDAVGLADLRSLTAEIPEQSNLNDFAGQRANGAGLFWAGIAGERLCIHESLCLKGEERVIVFDEEAHGDRAAKDFYAIAAEIFSRHPPE